jgi:hypothetical protein
MFWAVRVALRPVHNCALYNCGARPYHNVAKGVAKRAFVHNVIETSPVKATYIDSAGDPLSGHECS